MKTLDEAIAYFDNQTQQRHVYLTEDTEDIYNDALHYLKELKSERERKSQMLEEAHKAIEAEKKRLLEAFMENPPLTWDELKQMECKPVWVEYGNFAMSRKGKTKIWLLVDKFEGKYVYMRNCIGTQYFFNKDEEYWQAYRKERK